MNRTRRSVLLLVTALLVLSGSSYGSAFRDWVGKSVFGSLKVWTSTEIVKTSDLNANFATVNTAATALVVNSKVDPAAAIAQSKIVGGLNIPRAWAMTETVCTSGTCALGASNSITSVTRTGTGQYLTTLAYTASDVHYMAGVHTGGGTLVATDVCWCNDVAGSHSVTQFAIRCWDATFDAGPPATKDCNFSFAVYDNN